MSAEVTIYGLKNCDTCRKALRLFAELGVPATLIDVRDHPPGSTQLRAWCKHFGRDSLLNKRSTTWRGLSAAQKSVADDDAAVQLLTEYPALMKRPLMILGTKLLLGFDRQQILANCT